MSLRFVTPPPPPLVRYGKACVAYGDSLTFNTAYGVTPDQFYPGAAEAQLRALGCTVSFRNYGISGNTTAQMLTRVPLAPVPASPAVALIYGGANDSDYVAETTPNIVAIGQALQALGFSRLMVLLYHYINFSTGGDTLATPYPVGVNMRAAQQAAADTLGCPVADLYTFFRNRIVGGQDTQGSASWHVADLNAHLNAYGESLAADCVVQAMQAAGWIAALS